MKKMNIYKQVRERLEAGPVNMFTDLEGNHSFHAGPASPGFMLRIRRKPLLVILGGGHVGQAVCHLAAFIGMDTIVVDDRAAFSDPAMFPGAKKVIESDFKDFFSTADLDESCCAVICSRSHETDTVCLRGALQRKCRYIGMLGSAGKIGKCFSILEADGFSKEELSRIHAPIGLKIGGETPNEIAVAIIAEVMSVCPKEKGAVYIDKGLMDTLAEAQEGSVICTISGFRGSVSRKSGFLVLRPDMTAIGTIGGGEVEHLAIEAARRMAGKPSQSRYETFEHDCADGNCFGQITVFFEVI